MEKTNTHHLNGDPTMKSTEIPGILKWVVIVMIIYQYIVYLSLGILAHRTSDDEQGVSFITSETKGI